MNTPAAPCDPVVTKLLRQDSVRGKCGILASNALICTAGMFAFIQSAGADTRIWDGSDGVNFNWNNPLNWDANIAPISFDALVFDGVVGLSNNNDFSVDASFF